MTTTALKAAVANLLSCGVRSPDLVTALRSAGFSLDVPVSGLRGKEASSQGQAHEWGIASLREDEGAG